jgi:hypothetical protein
VRGRAAVFAGDVFWARKKIEKSLEKKFEKKFENEKKNEKKLKKSFWGARRSRCAFGDFAGAGI